jgi:hypothetical protein
MLQKAFPAIFKSFCASVFTEIMKSAIEFELKPRLDQQGTDFAYPLLIDICLLGFIHSLGWPH